MPAKEAELVSWLVESHLLMSMTAQRKDISDPDVVNTFARHVRSLRRLDYLYLLTICDIRGTNPKQWNDWKDKLLAELYNKTAAVINKGIEEQADKETNIAEIQTASLRRLQVKGINSHQANELWQTLNPEYFQSHTYGQIAWHTSLIIDARQRQKQELESPLIQTRVHESSRTIQLLIYMRDRDRIFYDVVSELTSSEVDIVNAHIVNATDGYALQSYQLTPSNLSETEMKLVADQIVLRLQDRLNNTDQSLQAPSDSINSKLKYFSSPTVVSFENSDDDKTTHLIVETIDRTGVLANIAKAIVDCKIKLLDANIVTAGEKALDYFTISSGDDRALSKEQKKILQQQLRDSL
jgi:[protein-PII] uridylyltransferase